MYSILPPVKPEKILEAEHFPSDFHVAVFRLWETVDAEKLAKAFQTDVSVVEKAAKDMGLPPQKHTHLWKERGYITTIRNAWHILPYDQLLTVLDMTEKQLAAILKEDDFLEVKLGGFKPFCRKIKACEPTEKGKKRLEEIKSVMTENFSDLFDGQTPFKFFDDCCADSSDGTSEVIPNDSVNMIFSYCGLYANALDNDIDISFPEALLKKYASNGVKAVWIPAVLYQLAEFPFDKSYSAGYEERRMRLRELIALAGKYGIKVYLYLNEPRCMPLAFFENHPELMGRRTEAHASLCTSDVRVLDFLRKAVAEICRECPEIGGFFVISCSENLTHCKSRHEGTPCPHCQNTPVAKLVSDVITAISQASRSVNPDIKTIAWTWAWEAFMTHEEIEKCIDRLPESVIIQCNSEKKKPFCIGGVKGEVDDYSMSIPGPGEAAKRIWQYAVKSGHEICAKVQINVTWECSTVPFLPVFDLIREHMTELAKQNVGHMMLSWTLGGYPSVNLKIATECLADSSVEKYNELLRKEYGEEWQNVKKAATAFSQAFREFPFHIASLYHGPQNAGPSNLLYAKPTEFKSTMTCYCYDDLEKWRSIYPKEVYISQLKKLCEKWKDGLEIICDMPECEFRQVAYGAYVLFRSSYLQAEFCDKRGEAPTEYLCQIINEEESLALLMYELMTKNNRIGYEAANHYYFNKAMLAEKVINCRFLSKLLKSNDSHEK